MSGDAAVPPTSGIISCKFGGILVKAGMGYDLRWIINMILATIAAIASFAVHNDKVAG